MIIKPVQMEYVLDFKGHSLSAIIQEIAGVKFLRMEIDGKMIDGVKLNADEDHGYVKILQNHVNEYISKSKNKYADIVLNHMDALKVVRKTMCMSIEEMGIDMNMCVISEKGLYTIKFSVTEFKDDMVCHIVANSLSDALEKSRMFTSIMNGINQEMTQNLTEFSEDGILEELGWIE